MVCPGRRLSVPGKAIGQRVDSFRCALRCSSVSMETAKYSGWPLTRVAINYCLLLSSVLNKGRDADKKYHLSALKEGGECDYNQLSSKMNLLLMLLFQEFCTALGCRLSFVGKYQSILCIFFFYLSSWCVALVEGVLDFNRGETCFSKCSSATWKHCRNQLIWRSMLLIASSQNRLKTSENNR